MRGGCSGYVARVVSGTAGLGGTWQPRYDILLKIECPHGEQVPGSEPDRAAVNWPALVSR